MIYISLGRHCDVASNIKTYLQKEHPTQFFDWVRTDFKCILHILKLNSIETLFNVENIEVDNVTYKHENNISITLKNFNKENLILLFHHDILWQDYTDIEMKEQLIQFIDKYKRRFDRLLELIKSNNRLCFIYRITGKIDYKNDIDNFYNLLKDINTDINFMLVMLVDQSTDSEKIIKYDKYLKINLSHYYLYNPIKNDWTLKHIDWKKVFDLIENN